MKKDNGKPVSNGLLKYAKKEPMFEGLPNLLEAIADRYFDDGTPREVWVLTISYETGQPMLKISDKSQRRTAQVIAQTITEAMIELDEHIKNGTLAWRSWAAAPRR